MVCLKCFANILCLGHFISHVEKVARKHHRKTAISRWIDHVLNPDVKLSIKNHLCRILY